MNLDLAKPAMQYYALSRIELAISFQLAMAGLRPAMSSLGFIDFIGFTDTCIFRCNIV